VKKIFISSTDNVKRFLSSMDRLKSVTDEDPKMALFYSEPGHGKTKCITWYVLNGGEGVLVRAKALMNGCWLLRSIVNELGQAPAHSTEDLFNQVIEQLTYRPTPIFIDEIDHIAAHTQLIETIRDIHDITHVPIILIGMANIDKRLMRHKHFYDRLVEIVKFSTLTKKDIASIINQMCEVTILDDGIDYITERTGGKFRLLRYWMRRAEKLASVNNLSAISAGDLRR
jgi:DNA transposition AAA+ family ATPase